MKNQLSKQYIFQNLRNLLSFPVKENYPVKREIIYRIQISLVCQ